MINNNNGIDNNFAVDLASNIESIGNLFAEVNVEAMEPKAQELINRLMMFQTQSSILANAREIQLIEFKDSFLQDGKAVAASAYVLSTFIEDKGMEAEFMEYAISKQSAVTLFDVDAMANDSFAEVGFDGEISQEQAEASQKTTTLYNAIKGGIPQELHKLLFDFNECFDDYTYVVAHEAYLQGFKEAMKSLNGNQANG